MTFFLKNKWNFLSQVSSRAATLTTESNDVSDGGDASEEQHDSIWRRDGDNSSQHSSNTNDIPDGVLDAYQQGWGDRRSKI